MCVCVGSTGGREREGVWIADKRKGDRSRAIHELMNSGEG